MKSLRARLLCGIAAVLGLVIAGFSATLYSVTARGLKQASLERLAAVRERLASSVVWMRPRGEGPPHVGPPPLMGPGFPPPPPRPPPRPPEMGRSPLFVEGAILAGLEKEMGIVFEIRDPDGKLLDFQTRPGWPADGFGKGEVAASGRVWLSEVASRPARSLGDRDRKEVPMVRLGVAVDVTAERASLGRLAAVLWLLGPAVFLLGAAGTGAAIHRGLVPLRRMGEAAARIDEKNLDVRVEVPPTGDELERLGASLNDALARLEAAFHRERAFVADASHELRTPVSILLTNLEVDLTRPRTAEEYRGTLETLLETTRRMRGIVESLLTLALADAGRLSLRREPVDMVGLLRQTVEQLGPAAAERNVTLALRAEGEARASGDPGLLRQLFDNLVVNAIRYNRPGGRVDIAVERHGETFTVSVSDTGIGIAPDHLPRLGERFYRVDKGRSRKEGGAGLGLSICRWIAGAHGGTIGIESRPGEGSTFRVSGLPGA